MSEEWNKNPRKMDKGSMKALPLPFDPAALSSSGNDSDEYQLGHRWMCAISLPVRHTGAEH
jgi:hypothetical protein